MLKLKLLVVGFLAVWFVTAACAQTGSIQGTVVDNWGGRAVASCVAYWEPTGEPEVPAEKIKDNIW